jgi:hypothetical protein
MTKRTAAEQAAYDKKLAYFHENIGQWMCNNLNTNVLREHEEDLANKEQDRKPLKKVKKSALKRYIEQLSGYFSLIVCLIFISILLIIFNN